ncbi:hydrophobic surface binding protein A-domain-containing protein [Halenospora varia]|nr:hydrophobic surface binding protein A-domain-containing protein [Halenospora varia]
MVVIINILLFISAASALVVKRDTSTILSDISTIDFDVKALTSAVNGYSGGVFGALLVENAESTLGTFLRATSQLSPADSNSIIAAVRNLRPGIQAPLTAIQNKKSQFASAGLTSAVQRNLATLKSDTDAFANALIAIAPADTHSQANGLKSEIESDFQVSSYCKNETIETLLIIQPDCH